MLIKVFGKPGCEFCKTTVKKFETFLALWKINDKAKISFFDMETVDGLAEGALLARWDGKVPLSEEFKPIFEPLVKAS
jgi:hydrogenase maturation factor